MFRSTSALLSALLWMESRTLSVVLEALIQHSQLYSMTLRTWALYTAALPTTFSLLATFLSAPSLCPALAVMLLMCLVQLPINSDT